MQGKIVPSNSCIMVPGALFLILFHLLFPLLQLSARPEHPPPLQHILSNDRNLFLSHALANNYYYLLDEQQFTMLGIVPYIDSCAIPVFYLFDPVSLFSFFGNKYADICYYHCGKDGSNFNSRHFDQEQDTDVLHFFRSGYYRKGYTWLSSELFELFQIHLYIHPPQDAGGRITVNISRVLNNFNGDYENLTGHSGEKMIISAVDHHLSALLYFFNLHKRAKILQTYLVKDRQLWSFSDIKMYKQSIYHIKPLVAFTSSSESTISTLSYSSNESVNEVLHIGILILLSQNLINSLDIILLSDISAKDLWMMCTANLEANEELRYFMTSMADLQFTTKYDVTVVNTILYSGFYSFQVNGNKGDSLGSDDVIFCAFVKRFFSQLYANLKSCIGMIFFFPEGSRSDAESGDLLRNAALKDILRTENTRQRIDYLYLLNPRTTFHKIGWMHLSISRQIMSRGAVSFNFIGLGYNEDSSSLGDDCGAFFMLPVDLFDILGGDIASRRAVIDLFFDKSRHPCTNYQLLFETFLTIKQAITFSYAKYDLNAEELAIVAAMALDNSDSGNYDMMIDGRKLAESTSNLILNFLSTKLYIPPSFYDSFYSESEYIFPDNGIYSQQWQGIDTDVRGGACTSPGVIEEEVEEKGGEDNSKTRVAFITAIYGGYETSCKPYAYQTIPCDFICFTDNASITSNNWIVDTTPYHLLFWQEQFDSNYTYFEPLDIGREQIAGLKNFIENNDHNFNIAKFYKTTFNAIPRLSEYDVVIWMDGTINIWNSEVAEHVFQHMVLHRSNFISFEGQFRGNLTIEAFTSSIYQLWPNSKTKYTNSNWGGQKQPSQEVDKQYKAYLDLGYNNIDYFTPGGVYERDRWEFLSPSQRGRLNRGLWVTCFIAFNMLNKREDSNLLLRHWTFHIMKYSTNDQMSFSFLIQSLNLTIHSLPDEDIVTGNFVSNEWFQKADHGN